MKLRAIATNLTVILALGGFGLIPSGAIAQNDHGEKNGHHKDHWNGAPPKKNGRHDNRDWNKDHGRRDDKHGWRPDPRFARPDPRQIGGWRTNNQFRRRDELVRRNDWQRREADHRQQTKNEWRNLAIASGAISVLGLLKNDSRLVFAGAAGALYSTYRYEQDRKSQNRLDRARAYYFSQPYFYRDGMRYDRRIVERGGERYYQFVRH